MYYGYVFRQNSKFFAGRIVRQGNRKSALRTSHKVFVCVLIVPVNKLDHVSIHLYLPRRSEEC